MKNAILMAIVLPLNFPHQQWIKWCFAAVFPQPSLRLTVEILQKYLMIDEAKHFYDYKQSLLIDFHWKSQSHSIKLFKPGAR